MEKALGIDLSAKPSRPSGYAVLSLNLEVLEHGLFWSDQEVLGVARRSGVSVAAIDAPLSKPKTGGYRDCERLMLSKGLRVYPVTIKWMEALADRAIGLAESLRRVGVAVVETHPSSSLRICGFRGDLRSERNVSQFIRRTWGLHVEGMGRHEVDAIVAAVAGVCFLLGRSRVFSGSECRIVLASRL